MNFVLHGVHSFCLGEYTWIEAVKLSSHWLSLDMIVTFINWTVIAQMFFNCPRLLLPGTWKFFWGGNCFEVENALPTEGHSPQTLKKYKEWIMQHCHFFMQRNDFSSWLVPSTQNSRVTICDGPLHRLWTIKWAPGGPAWYRNLCRGIKIVCAFRCYIWPWKAAFKHTKHNSSSRNAPFFPLVGRYQLAWFW